MGIYDNPRVERYALLGAAFGGGTLSRQLLGPAGPGKKGIVRDILVSSTVAMVGTTTVPEIRVGSAASDNSFARWLLGSSATVGYLINTVFRARTLCTNAAGRTGGIPMQLTDFANHIFLEGNNGGGTASIPGTTQTYTYIPADTAFFITGVAGVGGAPAGTADVYVDIEWW